MCTGVKAALTVLNRTAKAIARLSERQEKLTDAICELERDMRIHKVELLEIYDKIHRLFGRIAKRAAIDNPAPPVPTELNNEETPLVDEISKAIHARRARGGSA